MPVQGSKKYPPSEFGPYLKRICACIGWGPRRLARETGIHASTISRVERRERELSRAQERRIVDAVEKPLTEAQCPGISLEHLVSLMRPESGERVCAAGGTNPRQAVGTRIKQRDLQRILEIFLDLVGQTYAARQAARRELPVLLERYGEAKEPGILSLCHLLLGLSYQEEERVPEMVGRRELAEAQKWAVRANDWALNDLANYYYSVQARKAAEIIRDGVIRARVQTRLQTLIDGTGSLAIRLHALCELLKLELDQPEASEATCNDLLNQIDELAPVVTGASARRPLPGFLPDNAELLLWKSAGVLELCTHIVRLRAHARLERRPKLTVLDCEEIPLSERFVLGYKVARPLARAPILLRSGEYERQVAGLYEALDAYWVAKRNRQLKQEAAAIHLLQKEPLPKLIPWTCDKTGVATYAKYDEREHAYFCVQLSCGEKLAPVLPTAPEPYQ